MQLRDRTLDDRNNWEKVHKAMAEFRFRRELLNVSASQKLIFQSSEVLHEHINRAAESLHNLKGQMDRVPDSPLALEIAAYLNENPEAEQWRADAFIAPFDELAKKAAIKAR
jgi:hypothetical protein